MVLHCAIRQKARFKYGLTAGAKQHIKGCQLDKISSMYTPTYICLSAEQKISKI